MLAVLDVAASAQFYQDKLGFEIDFVMDDPSLPGYAVVSRDGFFVHLIAGHIDAAPGAKGGINISVEDVDAYYADVKVRGALGPDFPRALAALREHPPEDKPYGRRDFILVDPDGYALVFGHSLE